jgi:hypothetical protein
MLLTSWSCSALRFLRGALLAFSTTGASEGLRPLWAKNSSTSWSSWAAAAASADGSIVAVVRVGVYKVVNVLSLSAQVEKNAGAAETKAAAAVCGVVWVGGVAAKSSRTW